MATFAQLVSELRTFFGISGATLTEAVALMNQQMGLASEGTLPAQVARLITATGIDAVPPPDPVLTAGTADARAAAASQAAAGPVLKPGFEASPTEEPRLERDAGLSGDTAANASAPGAEDHAGKRAGDRTKDRTNPAACKQMDIRKMGMEKFVLSSNLLKAAAASSSTARPFEEVAQEAALSVAALPSEKKEAMAPVAAAKLQYVCDLCGKICESAIGLGNHLRWKHDSDVPPRRFVQPPPKPTFRGELAVKLSFTAGAVSLQVLINGKSRERTAQNALPGVSGTPAIWIFSPSLGKAGAGHSRRPLPSFAVAGAPVSACRPAHAVAPALMVFDDNCDGNWTLADPLVPPEDRRSSSQDRESIISSHEIGGHHPRVG